VSSKSSATQPRPPVGPIGNILANLRRAPRRVRRQSRDVIESAVSQLFDAAVRAPHAEATVASGEYRIDDLARLAGTTTRNVRVYRDRGLLHPPLRVGRLALYNDTHLTRLRLVTSMLDRGYNIAHVHEMLSAWEQGKDLGAVLGLESAIVGTWAAEKPETMARTDADRLIDDAAAFDRLIAAGLIRVDDEAQTATIVRPKLIEAFNEIRDYGIGIDKLIEIHEQVSPHIDEISGILVRAGAEHALKRIKPGEALPGDTEVAELITMLVRFRTQAVASVTATLAHSIESTIESLVAQLLADLIEQPPEPEVEQ
jgi:DNA-binding transcriptional MerR regulator